MLGTSRLTRTSRGPYRGRPCTQPCLAPVGTGGQALPGLDNTQQQRLQRQQRLGHISSGQVGTAMQSLTGAQLGEGLQRVGAVLEHAACGEERIN